VEIEGKMRYNVVNMFDDVGKMRNDAGRLSNNVEEMAQLHGRIAGRMRNIFGEIQPALREGQKNAPEKGACLYGFTREATEMFRFHKLDVWSLNTILKVL
jgi:hypothetical protein